MYIKSMVLEGFKSYAQRTEISGFDPMFNAITGLNGSGKSNILDGICFLLGITNLTQVRAASLQELVYKNGQAGVTKATVSVTFDNTNKRQSPLGYEQYDELTITRQVVIGGRNKYLVNGSNANNTRVQDLFRSVQLNVNNPHFLIMQGRITKVLNMKPAEILSMIEEAAGTRLYESKKENAQRTIEKKDAKLNEIDAILREEITPTLAKLKEERASYLEYQKIIRELEHLNKFYVAYQFTCAEETRAKSAEDAVGVQDTIAKLKASQDDNTKKISALEDQILALEKKRDAETGGALKRLEGELADAEKSDTKAQAALSHKRDNAKAEEKRLRALEKQRGADSANVSVKSKEMEKLKAELVTLKEQSEKDREAQAAAQKHLQAVNAGLSINQDGGQDATLNDQLISAKKDISDSDTAAQQAEMKLKHARDELKRKTGELRQTEQAYKKDEAVYDATKKAVAALDAEIKRLGYAEGTEEGLLGERKRLLTELQALREKIDQFEARNPSLHFEYKDPERNFDRRTVHGLIAMLVAVRDPVNATAVEVAAGGRLYNVLVDTEVTSKKILERGELKRRTTIIPLNKIRGNPIDAATVRKAEALVGRDNVHTSLSLVDYEKAFRPAMEYVFGGSFVCPDMDIAKKVTFDPQVSKKTVTLDGDSFDPAGLLSGGSRAQLTAILLSLIEVKGLRDQASATQQRIDQVDAELGSIKRQAARWRELKQQLELKTQEERILADRLKQSTHGLQLGDIDALQATVTEQEDIKVKAKELHAKATTRVAEIEDKLKNAGAVKERETKTAEAGVDKTKKTADSSMKKTKEKEQQVETVRLELEELEAELKTTGDQDAAIKEALAGYERQIEELKRGAEKSLLAVDAAKEAMAKHKELLNGCNKGIAERQSVQRSLQKESNAADLQLQELQHRASKCARDAKDSARAVEQLLTDQAWIADEKRFFGQPNTAYDFRASDPREAGRRIQKLTDTKDKLAKSVNMRAMNMLGRAEEQYNDLMKKRKIVLGDKAKIASVIAELDEKKNEALRKAHEQVTKDFGSIFSTLLPGTKAKLVAPDGLTILEGLEFKIAFGDVWKESLTELSGGQRSLVALSLILALLLFKPAPLYILDEVDAALDLSHTQNIGQMLRTHFRHSQFIVVSLKDGMFNNANVLFKTKFVDGLSTVSRIVQNRSTTGAALRPEGNGDDSAAAGGRKKSKKNV